LWTLETHINPSSVLGTKVMGYPAGEVPDSSAGPPWLRISSRTWNLQRSPTSPQDPLLDIRGLLLWEGGTKGKNPGAGL